MEKQMLTLKETAAYLNICQNTVRRMIADNEIYFLKVRGQYRIPLKNLEGWVDKKLVKAEVA